MIGRCICGVLEQSYCELMMEDEPYQRLKKALLNLDVDEIAFWEFATDFWVNLREGFDDCATEVWPVLKQFVDDGEEKLESAQEQDSDDASAVIIGFVIGVLNF